MSFINSSKKVYALILGSVFCLLFIALAIPQQEAITLINQWPDEWQADTTYFIRGTFGPTIIDQPVTILAEGPTEIIGTVTIRSSDVIINGISWQGIKISPSNPMKTSDSKLMRLENGVDNIILKNIEFSHAGMDNSYRQDCLYIFPPNGNAFDNITIDRCHFHDVNRVHILAHYLTNSTISNSFFENCHTNSSIHTASISLNNCTTSSGNVIRDNIFKDTGGTSFLDIKDSVQGDFDIYGNTFIQSSSRYAMGNGVACNTGGDTNYDMDFYRNTIIGVRWGASGVQWHGSGTGHSTWGNVWYDSLDPQISNINAGWGINLILER